MLINSHHNLYLRWPSETKYFSEICKITKAQFQFMIFARVMILLIIYTYRSPQSPNNVGKNSYCWRIIPARGHRLSGSMSVRFREEALRPHDKWSISTNIQIGEMAWELDSASWKSNNSLTVSHEFQGNYDVLVLQKGQFRSLRRIDLNKCS